MTIRQANHHASLSDSHWLPLHARMQNNVWNHKTHQDVAECHRLPLRREYMTIYEVTRHASVWLKAVDWLPLHNRLHDNT